MANHSARYAIHDLHNTPLAPDKLAGPRAQGRELRVASAVGVAAAVATPRVAISGAAAGYGGAYIAPGEDAVLGANVHAGVAFGDDLHALFVDNSAGDRLMDGVVDDVDGAVVAPDERAGCALGNTRRRRAL
jgi:hypothetical protein